MISVDKLLAVEAVYFHSSCPDGTAAAMIIAEAYRALAKKPKFYSVQYGTKFLEQMEARPNQLFVDITPPEGRWEEWKAHDPIVLDHHAGHNDKIKNITEGLNGVYRPNETHSGAMLAYDFVMAPLYEAGCTDISPAALEQWRDFAIVAMVRDTWKNKDSAWSRACDHARAMSFYGSKPLVEKVLAGTIDLTELFRTGAVISETTQRRIELLAKGAFRTKLSDGKRDYSVAIYNCSEKLISDVGNYMIDNQGVDIAASYFYLWEDDQNKLSISLRSNDSVKVNAICQQYGGGGHDRAAGFTLKDVFSMPPSTILEFIDAALKSMRTET